MLARVLVKANRPDEASALCGAVRIPSGRSTACYRGSSGSLMHPRGTFKTPTLREVARTAPYMHDGSLATLEAVVDLYGEGGHTNPGIDPEIHPVRLTAGEKRALVAFLRSLSGTIREGASVLGGP